MSNTEHEAENGPVPVAIRDAIAEQLSALVRGELPELLDEVEAYPAVLVDQPEDIWSHRQTWWSSGNGGWFVVDLPLWTEAQSPSDLTASFDVSPEGTATITNVHVG